MDVVVATPADYEGLATAACHHFDPTRLLAPSLAVQIFEPSKVMHLDVVVRTA
jgi:hypothetical protein